MLVNASGSYKLQRYSDWENASSVWSLRFCPVCDLMFPLVLSFAENAENPALCVTAVRHYWNTCQPLTQSPEERWQLQEPLEKILMALEHASMKHASVRSLSHFSLSSIRMLSCFLLPLCVSGARAAF